MLGPYDFDQKAIFHPVTRSLMSRMTFEHGGPDYDARYPDGIPTSIVITDDAGNTHDSGLVMYPGGHARNTTADLEDILAHKFQMLGSLAVKTPKDLIARLSGLDRKGSRDVGSLCDFEIVNRGTFE
jgi:2-methylcitrate dehydratase